MAAVLDDTTLHMAPRLPSTRPIDHRWNYSRGIIFSNVQRNAMRDFRWTRREGVVFGEASAQSHGSQSKDSAEHASFLNFKPTASRKASHSFWPTPLRHFHAAGANSESSTAYADPSATNVNSFNEDMLISQALPRHQPLQAAGSTYKSDMHLQSSNGGSHSKSDAEQEQTSEPSASEDEDSYQPSQTSLGSSGSERSEIETSQSPSSLIEPEETLEAIADSTPIDASEIDPQLTYHILPDDYRNAVLASRTTNAAFWSHKLYKNAEGKTPRVFYCTDYEKAETQAKEFLGEPVVGFDIEWEMGASPEKNPDIKKNVSLIQIAAEDKIGLFHVAHFKGETSDELMPPSLRKILESKDVVKAGVNISGDARRMHKCLNVEMTGLFELSHLYNVVTFSENQPHLVNRKLIKLATQVQEVLRLPLKKDSVRVSAWSKKLKMEQTDYAATDAYAGFRVYHELEVMRKRMEPTPPRPAFYEENKPLQLGDGTLVVAKTWTRVGASKKQKEVAAGEVDEDEEEEFEEFFDAVENFDTYELESSSAGVPLSGLQIPQSSSQSIIEASSSTLETKAAAIPTSAPPTTTAAPKRQFPLPTPEVAAADNWANTFRSSLPAEYNLRVGHATLRAYHLWHYQSLSCPQVAALLRDPPLALQTVASYVMQAVQSENLPFQAERGMEALEMLPKSVHGRYGKVIKRVEEA